MEKETQRFRDSTLFEGIVSLRAVLASMEQGLSDRRITEVFYDKEKIDTHRKEYDWLCHTGSRQNFTVTEVAKEQIDDMAVGASHGGLLFSCTERHFPALSDVTSLSGKNFFVMLDGIEDPYNFGYALRTLYAAGVDGVILTPRNWMSAAGVVCRSSAGASELLPMYLSEGADALSCMKEKGFTCVCADLRDSVPVYEAKLRYPLFLIVGGEKRGISRSVLEQADIRVRLDYARDFGASLSAASAASVISYEIYRQNRYL